MNESAEVLRQVGAIFSGGSVAGMTDAELLERFVHRRDESGAMAFEAIVVRHGPMVMRICRAALRNGHDAEDAFQATFLVLARKAGSLWVRDSLAGWLASVATKTASRSRSRIARHAAAPLPSEPFEEASDLERSDTRRALFEEVQRLPDRTRVPILLCYFEGMTHEAAAATLHLPVGTIHSRLSRGRERLKTRLIRRGLAPSGALLTLETLSEAAVSPALRDSTIKAAISFATSGALAAGSVPASVAALVHGVLGTMFLTKLQFAGAVVLSGSLLTAGAIVVAQGPETGQPAKAKVVPSQDDPSTSVSKDDRDEEISPVVVPSRPSLNTQPLSPSGEIEATPGTSKTTSAREILVRFRIATNQLELSTARFHRALATREGVDRAQGEIDLIVAQAEDQRDDLKDAIELLKAQRETKSLEVSIAQANLDGLHLVRENVAKLNRSNVVSTSEVAAATAAEAKAEGEMKTRQAEVSIFDIRIRQAERRLKGIESALDAIQAAKNAAEPKQKDEPAATKR
jgi:RNA polymerase sigma factor (sigma-70 family)